MTHITETYKNRYEIKLVVGKADALHQKEHEQDDHDKFYRWNLIS